MLACGILLDVAIAWVLIALWTSLRLGLGSVYGFPNQIVFGIVFSPDLELMLGALILMVGTFGSLAFLRPLSKSN